MFFVGFMPQAIVGVAFYLQLVGTGVAERRERNEWQHGVLSERERDRAAARPSTVRHKIKSKIKNKAQTNVPFSFAYLFFFDCRGGYYPPDKRIGKKQSTKPSYRFLLLTFSFS